MVAQGLTHLATSQARYPADSWLVVKEWSAADLQPGEALLERLLRHPEYADTYLHVEAATDGGRFFVDDPDLFHGPFRVRHMSPDDYADATLDDLLQELDGWTQQYAEGVRDGTPELRHIAVGSEPAEVVHVWRLETATLPDHVARFVYSGWLEYVVCLRDVDGGLRLRVIAASGD